MKKYLLFLSLAISVASFAQAPPQGINYQAVARNSSGSPLISASLDVQFSVWDAASGGSMLFTETHTGIATNVYGLFTAVIGSVNTGAFSSINWAAGTRFLEVSVDDGTGLVSMGRLQMQSVPYALYAANAGGGLTGATGATGAPSTVAGPTGATGSPGVVGPTGAPSTVAGPAGATGDTGATGSNGATGATGGGITSIIDNGNGTLDIVYASGTITTGILYGPTGTAGATGATGNNGIDGVTGATGINGSDGATGSTGIAGATGATGNNGIDGVTGATGDPGATGVTGNNGIDGATGATGLAGATGNTGTNGTNGSTGATGSTGLSVLNGTANPTPGVGNNGDFYINTSTNTIFGPKSGGTWPGPGVSLVGPAGPTGASGPTGTGVTGPTGPSGTNGTNGTNGATGATGAANIAGTVNQLVKFTGPATGGNSIVFDDGTNVGVGTATPGFKLDVSGTGRYTGTLKVGAYTLPSTDGTSSQVLKTNGAGILTWSADNAGTGTVTSITAGAGLTGGVITTTGTIAMPNTGTPGIYGSPTQVPVITTDAQGRVTNVTLNSIAGTLPTGSANQTLYNNGSGWVASGNLYHDGTNVGIGVTPGFKLDVGGDINVPNTGAYRIGGTKVLAIGATTLYVGDLAGGVNTGGQNSFVGYWAGKANTSASGVTFVGYQSGEHNTTGSNNTYLGAQAGNLATVGTNNTSVGFNSGQSNVNGNGNTTLGYLAGASNTGSNNTYIGSNTSGTAAITNATAIGSGATVTASNSVVLGSSANVGIGTTAPTQLLQLSNPSGATLSFLSNSTNSATIAMGMIGGNNFDGMIKYSNSSHVMDFYANNTMRMSLDGVTGGLKVLNLSPNGTVITNGAGELATVAGLPVLGTGTPNYTARWINPNTLGTGALVDNGFNVGIGTTSPSQMLQVENSTASPSIAITTGPAMASFLTFGTTATTLKGAIYYYNAANTMGLWTNGVSRMEIDGNGRIGMAGPADVNHSVLGYDLGGNAALGINNIGVKIGDVLGGSAGNYFLTDFEGLGTFQFIGGNVGIGTTTPAQKLDVVGNVVVPAANDYLYATAKTHYNSVPPAAFTQEGSTYTTSIGPYGLFVPDGSATVVGYLQAPVNLPDGATVTKLECFFIDKDGTYNTQALQLWRNDYAVGTAAGSAITMAQTAASTGSSVNIQSASTTTITSPVVNNASYTYYLRWGSMQANSNLILCKVVITYTVTKAD